MPSSFNKKRPHHRHTSSSNSFENPDTAFPPPAPLPIDSFNSPLEFSPSSNSFHTHDSEHSRGGTGSLEYPCPKPYGQSQLQNEKVALSSFSSKSVRFADPVQAVQSIPIPDRTHGSFKKTAMQSMDPFEVRIRFTQHLQHLNASVTSANKAAQYALKYRDMDEDLHSCILEQLEKNSMNNRANIMYFIEHLCDMATRESHPDYVRMIERDIYQVVNAVAPEDGSGAANVKVVRKVLLALQEKSFLQAQTVLELDEYLKERDNTLPDTLGSSPFDGDVEMLDDMTPKMSSRSRDLGGYARFDKKQAEQRIEEDRERHKKLRETIWAVPNGMAGVGGRSAQQVADEDVEFDRLLEETSELGEDDEDLYAEESEDRAAAAEDWREEYRVRVMGVGGE